MTKALNLTEYKKGGYSHVNTLGLNLHTTKVASVRMGGIKKLAIDIDIGLVWLDYRVVDVSTIV